jgi:hypothetical protein
MRLPARYAAPAPTLQPWAPAPVVVTPAKLAATGRGRGRPLCLLAPCVVREITQRSWAPLPVQAAKLAATGLGLAFMAALCVVQEPMGRDLGGALCLLALCVVREITQRPWAPVHQPPVPTAKLAATGRDLAFRAALCVVLAATRVWWAQVHQGPVPTAQLAAMQRGWAIRSVLCARLAPSAGARGSH